MCAKRKLSWVLAVCFILLTFAGCGSEQNPSSEDQQTETAQVYYNPLTGEAGYSEEALTYRPMAVVISNIMNANPQDGTTSADIIYEALAEGGITRMMGVFADYTKIPQVGPIRSAREYFVHFAMGLNAVYVHFGGSITAKELIASGDVSENTIDGGVYAQTAFYLDQQLKAERGGQEHAYFTSGELIQNAIDAKEVNMHTEDGSAYSPIFRFCYYDRVPGDMTANQVFVPFSAYNNSYFIYDEETGLYTKYQWGEKQTERNTGEAIQVKNVVVIFADMWNYKDTYLLQADLSGGTGYYATNGGAQPITWEKGDLYDQLKFYDANGEELLMNTGKTYICMMPTNRMDLFEISEEVDM